MRALLFLFHPSVNSLKMAGDYGAPFVKILYLIDLA